MSDEYDFMDDDDHNAQQQRERERARRRLPLYKYKDILQRLANRDVDEICIELDDLASVRIPWCTRPPATDHLDASTRETSTRV